MNRKFTKKRGRSFFPDPPSGERLSSLRGAIEPQHQFSSLCSECSGPSIALLSTFVNKIDLFFILRRSHDMNAFAFFFPPAGKLSAPEFCEMVTCLPSARCVVFPSPASSIPVMLRKGQLCLPFWIPLQGVTLPIDAPPHIPTGAFKEPHVLPISFSFFCSSERGFHFVLGSATPTLSPNPMHHTAPSSDLLAWCFPL